MGWPGGTGGIISRLRGMESNKRGATLQPINGGVVKGGHATGRMIGWQRARPVAA